MQAEPRRVRILLAEDPSSFQKRSRYWRCLFERAKNLHYVTWIRRLNPMRNIWIVSNRFSSRYLVGGLGFCDFNSLDFFRRGRGAIVIQTIVIKFVPIGFTAGIQHNTDANLPMMVTNLCQRFVEVALVLPLNVCPVCPFYLSSRLSNLDLGIGFFVQDGWKIAAAGDHDDHDYT